MSNGEGYDFSHDLLRDAAYAQVSRPRRWLLHRRVAQGLELLHADDIAAVAAQLAGQYARGGRARARTWSTTAGPLMWPAGVFAHVEAARLHPCGAGDRAGAQPSGPDTRIARSSRSWRHWRRRSTPTTATPRSELQAVLERSIELAESLGRREVAGRRARGAVVVADRPGP